VDLVNVYCDESRYSNPYEQYFLIGCLTIPRTQKPLVDERLKSIRRDFGFMPELKWSNLTEAKLPYLNQLLQVFFTSDLEFRAIIIDKSKLKLSSRQQPAELTFYKFYYLMLKGMMQKDHGYYIFVDQRTKTEARSLGELQRYLYSYLDKLNGGSAPEGERYLRQIQEVDSQKVIISQLLDLLLGAVGYYWNGFRGSPAKLKFLENLTQRLGKSDLKFSSPLHEKKWNQFVWEPKVETAEKAEGQEKRGSV
jgi:hypothetical protein